ncbi:hypothetical protein F2Q69_00004824 [Brassica cretica]|uniref:Uncharacterized protein n=1 Tax=Brassica cretica TaxID=69181 RepID=A0A8S9P8K1_BRACR|nr:hypothetical protein F2Q69_00004824 [Brassica cretica]
MIKYIRGVDKSFYKEDSSVAGVCLFVLELLLYVYFTMTTLPSASMFHMSMGFLIFILKKRRDDKHPFYSQVSSYRWLSLNHASVFFKKSLALLSLNTNTSYTRIWFGVSFRCSCSPSYHWHHVDGLNQYEVRRSFQTKENQEQVITLLRNSGFTWE